MLPWTSMSLFWVVTFLCPPEARENNGARDVSHFPSLSHKSHLVVKMEVQGPIEETFCAHRGALK